MSGFEVAGLVLGAFPIAISALDGYRRVAEKANRWSRIRLEYTRCSDDLQDEQVAFQMQLRQLLLPLIDDDLRLDALLAEPGGPNWQDAEVEALLEKRLALSYKRYLSCVKSMSEALGELAEEMAFDCDVVGEKLETPKVPISATRVKNSLNKDGRAFQAYKLKFTNGESTRKRLFGELRGCNEKLAKLLDTSDKDALLVKQRAAAKRASAGDASICSFWKTATAFFRALAAACRCQCRDQHTARLLLQHRAAAGTGKAEFRVLFTTDWKQHQNGGSALGEVASRLGAAWSTRIAEGGDQVVGGFVKESMVVVAKRSPSPNPPNLPGHQRPVSKGTTTVTTVASVTTTVTMRGVLRPKNPISPRPQTLRASVQFLSPPPSLAAPLSQSPTEPSTPAIEAIHSLCESLAKPDHKCRGYLTDDDRRYYVYSVAEHAVVPPSVTLSQILDGSVKPPPSRRERYAIAVILASSFLQLQDSPWVPNSDAQHAFDKASVVFPSDPSCPNAFLLDEPHIRRAFAAIASDPSSSSSYALSNRSASFSGPLVRLGITLLELCFGRTLESQSGTPDMGLSRDLKEALDFVAACKWLGEVRDEVGGEYVDLVNWCLLGHKSTPADRWRPEMLRQVVAPLQRYHETLEGKGQPR